MATDTIKLDDMFQNYFKENYCLKMLYVTCPKYIILGGPTQHFWRQTLVSTLRYFFKDSQNYDTGPATKVHRLLIIPTPPIEPNGINLLMGRNVAPSTHRNPIFAQR